MPFVEQLTVKNSDDSPRDHYNKNKDEGLHRVVGQSLDVADVKSKRSDDNDTVKNL